MQAQNFNVINQEKTLWLLAQQVSRAVWLEDNAQIIAGLAQLANYALDTGLVRKQYLSDHRYIGSIDGAMKTLFNTVERCAAGITASYSELYDLCTQLTRKILNDNDELALTQVLPKIHGRSATDWC